jgi:hypothetical protein
VAENQTGETSCGAGRLNNRLASPHPDYTIQCFTIFCTHCPVLSYSIVHTLPCSFLQYSTLSCIVLQSFCSVLHYPVLTYTVLLTTYIVLRYIRVYWTVLHSPALSYSSCRVLFCPAPPVLHSPAGDKNTDLKNTTVTSFTLPVFIFSCILWMGRD